MMQQLYKCSTPGCTFVCAAWDSLKHHVKSHAIDLVEDRLKSITPVEEQVIALLKDGGPMTRDQLVKKMGVPRTTIYDGLKKLINRAEVKKYPFYQTERSRGRPQVLFSALDDRK